MPRHQRGRNSSPISMFSFQDIMTSVMGVVLFITLMMVIELVQRVPKTMAVVESPRETPKTDTRALALRLAQLQEQYRRQLERTNALALVHEDGGTDVRASAAMAQGEIEHARDMIERARLAMEALKTQDPGEKVRGGLAELARLEVEETRLRALIESQKHNTRLTYIIQPGLTKSPRLLEVTDRSLALGSPNDSEPTVTMRHASLEDRLKQLRGLLEGLDPESAYVVLLIKPSGFKDSDVVCKLIKDAGLSVGTELVREDQQTLLRPEE